MKSGHYSASEEEPEGERFENEYDGKFAMPVVLPGMAHAQLSSRRSQRSAMMTGSGQIDYNTLKPILVDFCARTSSHGIPFIGSPSFCGRYLWTAVTVVCLLGFLFQTYWTLSEYLEYRTIIEMQLKFEPAPFPAATVCNLNAFKYHELKQYEEISQGFALWEAAVNTRDQLLAKEILSRKKRQTLYQPVFVRCVCNSPDDQCVPQRNPLETNATVCMCFEDANKGDIWPCYPTSVWKEKVGQPTPT
ncbi:hypothetical protein L596_005936 [Steinernema carpocapsae]|uniref:Uncharacterized protein n=1 Tax=Steinernema carpocapsae TaxID=34508 RepID=A0A4U8V708_STECR|nr:hypothetical protein L596_005936 [Steinernema carpocapsae]